MLEKHYWNITKKKSVALNGRWTYNLMIPRRVLYHCAAPIKRREPIRSQILFFQFNFWCMASSQIWKPRFSSWASTSVTRTTSCTSACPSTTDCNSRSYYSFFELDKIYYYELLEPASLELILDKWWSIVHSLHVEPAISQKNWPGFSGSTVKNKFTLTVSNWDSISVKNINFVKISNGYRSQLVELQWDHVPETDRDSEAHYEEVPRVESI